MVVRRVVRSLHHQIMRNENERWFPVTGGRKLAGDTQKLVGTYLQDKVWGVCLCAGAELKVYDGQWNVDEGENNIHGMK